MVATLKLASAALALLIAAGASSSAHAGSERRLARQIDFNREIRPILSDACFHCHGPDKDTRKAELRLDEQKGAFVDLGGYQAIVPNKASESELYKRITASDPDDLMPPHESGKRLSKDQIELIREWIAQGAAWQPHWSFVSPRPHLAPRLADPVRRKWVRNDIDRFIAKRLEEEGLAPESEASPETLIRRLTLDLTGLPPTMAEIDRFVADRRPDAYQRLVDRLLASPGYGEHQARYWLDAVRYADTHGLHLDNLRAIWPYRDWVIRSFNQNQRFDEFGTWQLAGDLLPGNDKAADRPGGPPTARVRDQLIATGFNRLHPTSSEGGSIPEELAARYVVDRVETTATVFMGLTAGCAVCHDHKYDPIPTRDVYSMFAFFNSGTDEPLDGNVSDPSPSMLLPESVQVRTTLAGYDRKQMALRAVIEKHVARARAGYVDPLPAAVVDLADAPRREIIWLEGTLMPGFESEGENVSWRPSRTKEKASASGVTVTAQGAGRLGFSSASHMVELDASDRIMVDVFLDPANPPTGIMLQAFDGDWNQWVYWGQSMPVFTEWRPSADAGKTTPPDAVTEADKLKTRRVGDLPRAGGWVRLAVPAGQLGLQSGIKITGLGFAQRGGTAKWDRAGVSTVLAQDGDRYDSFRLWKAIWRARGFGAKLPADIRRALEAKDSTRGKADEEKLFAYFLERGYTGTRAALAPLHAKEQPLTKERDAFVAALPRTLIFRELATPRPAHILKRGQYDDLGERVERQTLGVLPPMPRDAPRNRLGFARWLFAKNNPLTARVAVNRFWQQHFGTGIVKTAEDLGSQGEIPAHPELLDWLALRFVDSGWDVKALHRQIVNSATYRQSARLTAAKLEVDPGNRLLARGPRFRLDAESIRDNALAVSGLLVNKAGGPGVKPYQPTGLWEAVAYPTSDTREYKQDRGDALYRRSIYSFWKRTAGPASMVTFDAPARETCLVRRERTNTPLQALVLLNDPQFVEAARRLGERMMTEGAGGALEGVGAIESAIAWGFRLATGRAPEVDEVAVLKELHDRRRAAFAENEATATQLLTVGESARNDKLETRALAAFTVVANALLNLDETITRN